jgi:hypothetical protein
METIKPPAIQVVFGYTTMFAGLLCDAKRNKGTFDKSSISRYSGFHVANKSKRCSRCLFAHLVYA